MNTGLGDAGGLIDENVIIKNIPIRKWFHVALRLENKNFDSYVNGILHTKSIKFITNKTMAMFMYQKKVIMSGDILVHHMDLVVSYLL